MNKKTVFGAIIIILFLLVFLWKTTQLSVTGFTVKEKEAFLVKESLLFYFILIVGVAIICFIFWFHNFLFDRIEKLRKRKSVLNDKKKRTLN